jgi:hypothetical protein
MSEESNKRKNYMMSRDAKSPRRRLMMSLIATLAALCLLLVTTIGALADTVNIFDKAGVLNTSQVQSEAAKLPYPVNIYTMNNFTGTETAFNQEAVRTLNDAHNPRLIVIAIDTHKKFLAIVGGKAVSTANSVYNDAVNAFKSHYNGGDYTGATIAALGSLQSSLGAAPASGNGSGQTNTAVGFGLLPLCLVGLLVLGLIVIVGVVFMRRARMRVPPYPTGTPYQQPYNQGYPPNSYGPGSNQGPGMNPWVAGGLGAAAGGFIGYELGKQEGEEQGREQGNVGGGDFGGGAGGTFGGDDGGGAGGDFGGGGGGDFGGGAGGDFGGGGGGSF